MIRSQEWRRQTKQHMFQAHDCASPLRIVLRHFPALSEGLFKITLCIHYRFAVRIQAAIFKVVIEAPIIQINCPACSDKVVRNGHFGVAEAGCELKDPHTVARKAV